MFIICVLNFVLHVLYFVTYCLPLLILLHFSVARMFDIFS